MNNIFYFYSKKFKLIKFMITVKNIINKDIFNKIIFNIESKYYLVTNMLTN